MRSERKGYKVSMRINAEEDYVVDFLKCVRDNTESYDLYCEERDYDVLIYLHLREKDELKSLKKALKVDGYKIRKDGVFHRLVWGVL